jgi:AcrR family transcriptional regulator
MTANDRVYGGRTAEEREGRRRQQLLDAGLEVFAARGWEHATIKDVCGAAGLSQRYFYDHFASKQQLFLAICGGIAEETERLVGDAARAPGRAPFERVGDVLSVLAGYFAADPRRVRVALVESMATPELRAFRAELLAAASDRAARLMRSIHPDPARADVRGLALSAQVLTGGIAELLVGASATDTPPPRDALVTHLTRLYVAAATLDVPQGVR